MRAPSSTARETSAQISSSFSLERCSPAVHVVETAHDVHREPGHVAVAVHVPDLGELVVVDDWERQLQHAAGGRARCEQVGLRTHRPGQRGDDLLADGVERRVGDLGELLAEVVEQQPRPVRQRGDRGVGAHGADRLGAGSGDGRHQDAKLLLGVAEHLLATGDRGVGVHDVLEVGQVLEPDEAGVQPLVVGLLGRQGRLDLGVLDDPVLGQVEQEHPAGLEPALAGDGLLVDVEDTGLRRQHDQAVLGDPEASRAQAVAVQHGADLVAVGEGHAGRAVPRLHQRGVELIERPPSGVHGLVVLPRLGNHHHDRMRQLAAAEVEQLEHFVERGGVAALGITDREQPLDVAGDEVALQRRLAGPHPVAVAAGGVDLAVVRDEAERVRQRPARERVGGEPAVHDAQGRLHTLVTEVGIERVELLGREHPLVDQRAGRQRREVDAGLVLGALAQAEGEPVEVDAAAWLAGRRREHELEGRHGAARHGAEDLRVDRNISPSEDLEALLARDRLDRGLGFRNLVGIEGQECHADGVRARLRQLETVDLVAGDLPQEPVGHLHEHARAVAGVGLAAHGAAVVEVAQRGEAVGDDLVAGHAGEGRDHGDAAGVVLVPRVVHALGSRKALGERRSAHCWPLFGVERWIRTGDDVGPSQRDKATRQRCEWSSRVSRGWCRRCRR